MMRVTVEADYTTKYDFVDDIRTLGDFTEISVKFPNGKTERHQIRTSSIKTLSRYIDNPEDKDTVDA